MRLVSLGMFFFSRFFGDSGIGSLAGILEFISMT